MSTLTNWRKNIAVFKIDSVINWFYVPIGVWVLVWTQFFSFTQIGLAMTISLAMKVILELPSGALADIIGRKKTVSIGRFLLFLGYVILFYRRDFLGFLIYEILYHTDEAFNSGAQSALLYDSLKENNQEQQYKKTEASAFTVNTIGMVVGSILGGVLYKINYFLPYAVMIPIAAIGFIASLFYEEPTIDSQKFSIRSYLNQNINGFKHIFENINIRAVSFFSIAVSIVTYTGIWYYYEPRLAAGGFDPRILATLVAGTYAIRAVGSYLVPWIDKSLKASQVPVFLGITQTLGSALSFITTPFGAIGSVYTRKFTDGLRYPLLASLQNEQIASNYRATSLSAISLVTNLIVVIFGLGIGKALDVFGAPVTVGIFALFGFIFVIPSAFKLSKLIGSNSSSHIDSTNGMFP